MRPQTVTPAEFIQYLDRGEVPPFQPEGIILKGILSNTNYECREECCKRGMWALVYKTWVHELAVWIGNRTVLEIMAGRGWLARALADEGVTVTATDDTSWDDRHCKSPSVYRIQKLDALEAVKTIQAHILIASWPPYGDEAVTEALKAWGHDRPVVYIGEGKGGCNAPDSFWELWEYLDDRPRIRLAQWQGIHDYVMIGHLKEAQ